MRIYGNKTTVTGTKKTIRKYKCIWCGYEFKQYVAKSSEVSDQVQCKNCLNFIKTWE